MRRARHAVAWPTFPLGKLLVLHAPFPLEWFPTLVDTSTWFSSLPLLSVVTFSCIVPFQYFLHSPTKSCKVWGAPTKSLFSRGGVGRKRTFKSPCAQCDNQYLQMSEYVTM